MLTLKPFWVLFTQLQPFSRNGCYVCYRAIATGRLVRLLLSPPLYNFGGQLRINMLQLYRHKGLQYLTGSHVNSATLATLSGISGMGRWRNKVSILWRPWIHNMWCMCRHEICHCLTCMYFFFFLFFWNRGWGVNIFTFLICTEFMLQSMYLVSVNA